MRVNIDSDFTIRQGGLMFTLYDRKGLNYSCKKFTGLVTDHSPKIKEFQVFNCYQMQICSYKDIGAWSFRQLTISPTWHLI